MKLKTYLISMLIGVIILAVSVAFFLGIFQTDSKADKNSSVYCQREADCSPYCGYDEQLGRGKCVNRAFIFEAKNDLNLGICKSESLFECNSCKCLENECQTVPNGVMEC